ncbi:MAG: aminopeptidase [Anaerolineae bacterium]|jgi:aminopeptidase|nr:aminopeptidase [Anaerolineae bacterium]
MTDQRLTRLATLLVNYSTRVKPGDWVGILGDVTVLPALREIYKAVLAAGGNPSVMLSDEAMHREFLRNANDDQVNWLDPAQSLYYDKSDVYIRIGGGANTRAMSTISGKRVQQLAAARNPWLRTRLERAAVGDFRWVGAWYPNEASAQEASLSLEEYADFVYSATFCDREDPVAAWQALGAMQQAKVDYLRGKREVVLSGPNIDLRLSIAEREFINCCGDKNMPDGEIFTGPVEDSVNGWVRFSYPSIVGGRAVSGIELRFAEGKVVEAHAQENDELLQAQLNTDAGARYLGEFAIGTNFGINRFTSNILFDEKIGGTVHMAIGMGYPETGSKNRSAVHWDMICDMRTDSTIHVDGELFYKDGQFAV